MALVSCRTCGHQVARQAEACPSCGHTYPGLAALCPACGGRDINVGKKGFSAGAAAGGALLLGPIGALAGAAGLGGVRYTCATCDHTWQPSKEEVVYGFYDSTEAASILAIRQQKEAKASGESAKLLLGCLAIAAVVVGMGAAFSYLDTGALAIIVIAAVLYLVYRRRG